MIKYQVKNGKDYRTVDQYRGTIDYVEDYLGNRYKFVGSELTIEDVYALFEDPVFLNQMITNIPIDINTIAAKKVIVAGNIYDVSNIQVSTGDSYDMSVDLNNLDRTIGTTNYRVRFTPHSSPHISWPKTLMSSNDGIIMSETVFDNSIVLQQLVTDSGDIIIRVKDRFGNYGPWKKIFAGLLSELEIGNWVIRENEDGSLGFFNRR